MTRQRGRQIPTNSNLRERSFHQRNARILMLRTENASCCFICWVCRNVFRRDVNGSKLLPRLFRDSLFPRCLSYGKYSRTLSSYTGRECMRPLDIGSKKCWCIFFHVKFAWRGSDTLPEILPCLVAVTDTIIANRLPCFTLL